MRVNNLRAQYIEFNNSFHTFEAAASEVKGSVNEFVKNICMIGEVGQLIVAIVKGEDRVSILRVSKVLNISHPRLITKKEVLEATGYPAGAVPSFGFEAIFLIDKKVTELEFVYTSGGSFNSLVKIHIRELLKANKGVVKRIRE
ncbi:hypothetical protein DCC39_16565 [Pueribacillus theae]|uniref:YbaK/aminoacyl-tRNA synthetase-associated domain-containing protein n=1 Tax=Pueribacillus theae TaxID=2171751 RepID=A0A2U1JRM9_9BACI|nr:hypothetical protein DCC39_16565 [Pueribacillus theae]